MKAAVQASQAEILSRFPNASKSLLSINAAVPRATLPPELFAPTPKLRRRKVPNKTEAAFGRILEARQQRGEITRYEFESIAFRWGGTADAPGMLYSPDFVVFDAQGLTLVEIKGGHIFDRDLVRFKGCRAQYPEFRWEMWRYAKGEWRRIH